MLINRQYIKRSPRVVKKKAVPELSVDDVNQYKVPKIDLNKIYDESSVSSSFDSDVFWEINFDRFHEDMR